MREWRRFDIGFAGTNGVGVRSTSGASTIEVPGVGLCHTGEIRCGSFGFKL